MTIGHPAKYWADDVQYLHNIHHTNFHPTMCENKHSSHWTFATPDIHYIRCPEFWKRWILNVTYRKEMSKWWISKFTHSVVNFYLGQCLCGQCNGEARNIPISNKKKRKRAEMKLGWEIEPDNVQLLALLLDRFEARQQEPRGKEKNQENMRARIFLNVKDFFLRGICATSCFLKRILIKSQPNISRPKCDSTYWDAVKQGCALSGGVKARYSINGKLTKSIKVCQAQPPHLTVYSFKFILHPIIHFILCWQIGKNKKNSPTSLNLIWLIQRHLFDTTGSI